MVPVFNEFARQLDAYKAGTGRDTRLKARALGLLKTGRKAFERSSHPAHFTGSCFIVDPREGKTLLVHHRKLERWLQPGGHCDGVPDPFVVAWIEAYEETGLDEVIPWLPHSILDFDVLEVPAHLDVPAHLHYDVRYLFTADSFAPLAVSEESYALSWVRLDEIASVADDPSLFVLRDKALAVLDSRSPLGRPVPSADGADSPVVPVGAPGGGGEPAVEGGNG